MKTRWQAWAEWSSVRTYTYSCTHYSVVYTVGSGGMERGARVVPSGTAPPRLRRDLAPSPGPGHLRMQPPSTRLGRGLATADRPRDTAIPHRRTL